MKILDLIAHLLYPWKCVFCESVLKDTDICRECEEKLPYTVGDSAMQKFPFIDNASRRFIIRIRCAPPFIDTNSAAVRLTVGVTQRLCPIVSKIILIAAVLM